MGMNITEFAALAGVSKTAVSRYFNNGYLSAEKRAAIEEAVRRTGYSPSEAARGLRTRRTRQIGVVLPRLSGESTARVVDGISLVLGDKGYRMLLANTANRPEREVEYLDALRQSGVDGVIFLASIFTPEHRAVLKSMHMPVVIVAQQYDGYSCVYHDDLGAARDLTSLLIRRGSHPAYIGVTAQDRAAGLSRREGYVQAMREAGLPVRTEDMCVSGFRMEEGYARAKDLLQARHPDGIFCATDAIAIGPAPGPPSRRHLLCHRCHCHRGHAGLPGAGAPGGRGRAHCRGGGYHPGSSHGHPPHHRPPALQDQRPGGCPAAAAAAEQPGSRGAQRVPGL